MSILINYILPILSFLMAGYSLYQSSKINKLEHKIKEYELRLKEMEISKIDSETPANIKARIINISKDKYKIKVWNSGKNRAYSVDYNIDNTYGIILFKEITPLEYLDGGNSFEETVVLYPGHSSKFIINLTWKDENGVEQSNNQLSTV